MKMVWLLGFELSCGLESRLESCQQLWAFGVEGKKISNESWEIKEKFRLWYNFRLIFKYVPLDTYRPTSSQMTTFKF